MGLSRRSCTQDFEQQWFFWDLGFYQWLIKDTFNGFSRTFGPAFTRRRAGHWTVCWKLDFKLIGCSKRYRIKEKKKLTDTGFFGFSDLGNFLVFSLDVWIRLICYQSTSGTKIYPHPIVNKSRISLFNLFGIYPVTGNVTFIVLVLIRKINS